MGNQRESGIETGPEDESGTPSVAEVDSGNVACIEAKSGIETGAGGKSRSPPVTEVESGIGTGAGVESGIETGAGVESGIETGTRTYYEVELGTAMEIQAKTHNKPADKSRWEA
ncbi:hypothetical protein PHYSODRAFT_248904 [Phytophthora sojae]|uniref:Uncharacterized protein n=1 Tax=Phytophthora sojae (strain P6497) TaxID=1094619 RepID=G4ZXF2_PHYSP|nr:hypothetical protein PHYSODRAFT_248904 [Phytophthora sojae]EGZ12568.1 hypothetical protein PHYSODRAFT_248904 [Phytophthora sojae]|eukprot:XP_009532901.1 hypothetical protein PHYSODRAFT_248904 [Phytophthora sojae]